MFLFPIEKPQTFETAFPSHPDFPMVNCSENSLSKDTSRLLVTLVRSRPSEKHN